MSQTFLNRPRQWGGLDYGLPEGAVVVLVAVFLVRTEGKIRLDVEDV